MDQNSKSNFYRYWGKAQSNDNDAVKYHLLPYHCLDVSAVAAYWWDMDGALRHGFLFNCAVEDQKLRAWVLFFIALHDIGKLDVRFQLKANDVALHLNPVFSEADPSEAKKFNHGTAGLNWFLKELSDYGFDEYDAENLRAWMIAAAGHHGRGLGFHGISPPWADDRIISHDRQARRELVEILSKIFLTPADIHLGEAPPLMPSLFTGFCSVCDWLGSNTDFFPYEVDGDRDLIDYFQTRQKMAMQALYASGMLSAPCQIGGMAAVFPELEPRGVQSLVNQWPLESGLTLIEAPTGSGKTEAALAYASRLLAAGLADSIIFALPTQATANAMLTRLEEISKKLFPSGGNVVLAHGKAGFNSEFLNLKRIGLETSAQGKEEALAQCTQWLATSRKRVFLGQIGVCTIDQVLLSVLPIRHYFVRAFGVRKSILIVDEIHAYDSYMNGLLDLVLKAQSKVGGSAILLSATLQSTRREQIFANWGTGSEEFKALMEYPLVSHAVSNHNGRRRFCTWKPLDAPEIRQVKITCEQTETILPSPSLIDKIINAGKAGARVAVICNLVADAQNLAHTLKGRSNIPVDLFHSRFRFCDRQRIELDVLTKYGKDAERGEGRILVATQVIEQSLDLDFDWMVTQICPVDLLFQRLGRLHRHPRYRPTGFDKPRCTILVPDGDDYGLHNVIYGDALVLWRTVKLLEQNPIISFPGAYRHWIEAVYAEEKQPDEPEKIILAHEAYIEEEEGKRFAAKTLAKADANPLNDTDGNVAALTRDGEMNLSLLPMVIKKGKRCFLDGAALNSIDEWQIDEALNLQTIPVPHSWRGSLPENDQGIYYLPMELSSDGSWIAETKNFRFTYHPFFGLEKGKL